MTPNLNIQLTPQAQKIIAGFQTLPGRLVQAVISGMKLANEFAIGNIQQKHLIGKGPFPPSEHRLGVRSSRLWKSANASEPRQISSTQVQSAIGSNVVYAAIHEFGGRIHHEAKTVTVRHKTDAKGNLIKQAVNPRLLVFAKADAKHARTKTVEAKVYDVEMPERAPFRTGLKESEAVYKRTISLAIVAEWGKMNA